MANPQINISSLDFDGLKSSLKGYLKSLPNSDLNSFDYDGSAINTLLDVFAYNTLYYAYYANMIANEMFLDTAQLESNFISLLKPLGVLLPSRTASSSDIVATTPLSSPSNPLIKRHETYFIGINTEGLPYRFYTTEDINLSAEPVTFKVYEANTVVKDFITTVDITNQKAFIGTTDLDINTLKVTVTTDGVEQMWSLYAGSEPVGPEAKVYFIDRTNTGFYLLFGKRTINDFSTNYGKNITAADTVKISYLIPNGEVGNGVSTYTSPSADITITNKTTSAGGRLTPDLDVYRFSAPKLFAANDRAITKDDYYGLLLNSGLLPANIQTSEQINVWGGEEVFPPAYGRVFISLADDTLTADSPSIKNCISYIKKKSAVTVLPEYTQPQTITANLDLSISGTLSSTTKTAIKNLVNTYFNSPRKFNNTILFGDIRSLILSSFSVPSVNMNSVSLSFDVYGSAINRYVSFKNELMPPASGSKYSTFKSGTITYQGVSSFLGDTPTIFNASGTATEGDIHVYRASDTLKISTSPVGNINYTNGLVTIYPNILPTTTTTQLTAKTKNQDNLVFNGELLLSANTTINGS